MGEITQTFLRCAALLGSIAIAAMLLAVLTYLALILFGMIRSAWRRSREEKRADPRSDQRVVELLKVVMMQEKATAMHKQFIGAISNMQGGMDATEESPRYVTAVTLPYTEAQVSTAFNTATLLIEQAAVLKRDVISNAMFEREIPDHLEIIEKRIEAMVAAVELVKGEGSDDKDEA